MIDTFLSILAPHHCSGCGKIGTLLCDNCKYNIISEPFSRCVLCGGLQAIAGVCHGCSQHCKRAWCVGERADALKELIDAFKFERVRAADRPLASLLAESLPSLPANTVVVPIPTIAPHRRMRGYDQTELLARRLARQLQRPMKTVLYRKTNSAQRGATKKQRELQAAQAFGAHRVNDQACYLLVDDIVTTGATIRSAAKVLKAAGAQTVWTAIVARQPLD